MRSARTHLETVFLGLRLTGLRGGPARLLLLRFLAVASAAIAVVLVTVVWRHLTSSTAVNVARRQRSASTASRQRGWRP